MDVWKVIMGAIGVLLVLGAAVIVWAVIPPRQDKRRSPQPGPPKKEKQWWGRKYDEEGYDQWGYDARGYDRSGYNRQGYDASGRNAQGVYNRMYDVAGFSVSPYSEDGFLNPWVYPIGVTKHARERIEERMIGREKRHPNALAYQAYCFGKSARQIKRSSAELVWDIQETHQNGVVLIYRGYVYIFSRDNQLITVYRNQRISL